MRTYHRSASSVFFKKAPTTHNHENLFAQLVHRKYSRDSSHQPAHEINLSYEPILNLCLLPSGFSNIRSLSLNHCDLTSISGIQQFLVVEYVSLKYNNLSNYRQVFKISKTHLRSLDITGNDIEYMEYTRYDKLITWFTKLQELNGNDYRLENIMNDDVLTFRGRNGQSDGLDTISIFKKLQNLKISTQTNNRQRTQTLAQTAQLSQYKQKSKVKDETAKKVNMSYQNNNYETEEGAGFASDEQQYNPNYQDKENFEILNNISLSRVEMVKSVMKTEDEISNKGRKRLLIQTNKAENIQVYQPTATFARQKQVVTENNKFQFKRNDSLGEVDEQDQDPRMLSNHTYTLPANHTYYNQNLGVSRIGMSTIVPDREVQEEVYQYCEMRKEDAADALYFKNMMKKSFKVLLHVRRSVNNMPRQKKFF